MRKLNANRIVALLELPTEDRRPTGRHIQARAAADEIIAALTLATTPLTRVILCQILGNRHVAEAVPVLIAALGDAESGVRSAAADSLAKIGDPQAGPALLAHFHRESVVGVCHMLAAALGACQYAPAIPALVRALADPNATLRGCAAWSLGALRASEAQDALEHALERETDSSYALTRMQVALQEIQSHRVRTHPDEPDLRAADEKRMASRSAARFTRARG